MKNFVFGSIVIIVVSLLITVFSYAEMRMTPDGVTFPNNSVQESASEPTWHQILPANERFQNVMPSGFGLIKNYKAVLDKETGLVWQKATDNTQRTWVEACEYCYMLELANRKGWRLPTIEELASLVDPSEFNPALPTGHPFLNAISNHYWSITTAANLTNFVYSVYFYNGDVTKINKDMARYTRCVRGGKGYDGR